MERLPREIVHDILSRLPTSSLFSVKLVCRSWQNLLQDPLLIILHFTRFANTSPCLVLLGDYPIQNQLYAFYFYPHNNNIGIIKDIHVPATMSKLDIAGSCNGWLCLSDSPNDNYTFHLYNPFTRDCTELPNSTHRREYTWRVLGFGFSSVSKEYKVLKISYRTGNTAGSRRFFCGYSRSKVEILNVGSPTWRSLGEMRYRPILLPSQIIVNGRLHWAIRRTAYRPGSRRIISFDLEDEKFREVTSPNSSGYERYGYGYHKLNLVVIGGCLSVVCDVDYGLFERWIMKEYGGKESWTKQYSVTSHLPKELEQDVDPALKISKLYRRSFTRVICSFRNGVILLQYQCRALIAYDPKSETFKDVTVPGMPNLFEAVHHVGMLP